MQLTRLHSGRGRTTGMCALASSFLPSFDGFGTMGEFRARDPIIIHSSTFEKCSEFL